MKVVLIGASNNPDKYAYKAFKLLRAKGHVVFAIHPHLEEIQGHRVYRHLHEILDAVDTVSLYVSKTISDMLMHDIFEKSPRRIIFNPGAENPILFQNAVDQGITAVNACTILLLKTGQF